MLIITGNFLCMWLYWRRAIYFVAGKLSTKVAINLAAEAAIAKFKHLNELEEEIRECGHKICFPVQGWISMSGLTKLFSELGKAAWIIRNISEYFLISWIIPNISVAYTNSCPRLQTHCQGWLKINHKSDKKDEKSPNLWQYFNYFQLCGKVTKDCSATNGLSYLCSHCKSWSIEFVKNPLNCLLEIK